MRKGFTLIELLVVIAIIGILATLVITQVSGAQLRARNSNAASDVSQMGKAIELYKNDDSGNGNPITVAAAATTDATLIGTAETNSFTLIFSGVANYTSGSAAYAVDINKTPNANYTYTYDTSGGTARANNATCYVIQTSRVQIGTVVPGPYSIFNGGNSDSDQLASC